MTMTASAPQRGNLRLGEVYLVPAADGGLTMRTPRRSAVLRGRLVSEVFPRLLPLLDGTRDFEGVLTELASDGEFPNLEASLRQLLDMGVVEFAEPAAELEGVPSQLLPKLRGQDRFMRQHGGDDGTTARIASGSVLLAGEGPLMPDVAVGLAASGVRRIVVAARRTVGAVDVGQSTHIGPTDLDRSMGEVVAAVLKMNDLPTLVEPAPFPESKLGWQQLLGDIDVAVVVQDAPVVSLPWMDEFNRATIAAGTPWTTGALLQRANVHVGPSVIPGQTACWKCFEFRFKSNLSSVVRYEEFQDYVASLERYVEHGSLPSVTAFTGAMVALEGVRLLAAGDVFVRTAGSLLAFDLWELRLETHPVLKLPRCPHCSTVSSVPQERTWS